MPYRLIECTLDNDDLDRARELAEESKPIQKWSDQLDEGRSQLKILISVERTEALIDKLTEVFSDRESFRMMLLNVEATIPRPEQEEEESGDRQAGAGDAPDTEGETPGRISREELYADVEEGSRFTRVYAATIILSVVVASVGLLKSNVAVIIGAMVIAPLLGPNVSLCLALTLGDLKLAWRSVVTAGGGLLLALVVSLLIGFFIEVDPGTEEIALRTVVGLGDVAIALAAGSAGVLAFTRGLPTAIIGVMVAVALLPPLANVGLLLGSGYYSLAFGATVLLVTNLVCINLAGILTFLVQGIRPREWWEEEKASKYVRIAVTIWLFLLVIFVGLIMVWW